MEKMTNDLISRSALLKIIREWPEHLGILINPSDEEYAERTGILETLAAIAGEVDRLPSIDAVPVVRCKDCRHNYGRTHMLACSDIVCDYHMSDGFEENDFCSYGAKMDGDPGGEP